MIDKLLKIVNKDYWNKSNHELELLASNYKVGEYCDPSIGRISRKIIIDQLIDRDKYILSYIPIFISILSLIISVIALLRTA